MTGELILFLGIGALTGGFINGLAGFGVALFSLGWWLQVVSPLEAVALSLLVSITSGIHGLVHVWRGISWARLFIFFGPALLGIPLGLELLKYASPFYLKLLVAGMLLLYGAFFAFRSELPKIKTQTNWLDGFVGFTGGVMGSFAGLSGALPTMWCAMRPWPKGQIRAILQPFNVAVLAISAILLASRGAYDTKTLTYGAIVVPVAFVSAFAGIFVYKKLSDDRFRRLLIILMLVSGTILLIRTLFESEL